MFQLQAEHQYAPGQYIASMAGLIDSLFKGRNLLLQLLCHTNKLLTSLCKQTIIM